MKCPNEYCGGFMNEFVDSTGRGTHYCLDGCGYYKEFQLDAQEVKRRLRAKTEAPVPPRRRPRSS